MEVYDINGNRINEYDLSLGKLEASTRVRHHEAIEPVAEISRWEEKHHLNGGVSRRKIVEQPAIPGVDAWDEEVTIYTYIPYMPEELEAIEEEKNRPTMEQRLIDLEEAIELLISGVTE